MKLTAAALCALSLLAASCDDDDDNNGPDDNVTTTTRYAGSTTMMAAGMDFETADTMTIAPMGNTGMMTITMAARKLTIASANLEVSVGGFTIDSVVVKGPSNNMSRKNPFNVSAKVGIGGNVNELTVTGKLESGLANGSSAALSLADMKIGNMPVSISSFSFLGDKIK